MDSSATGLHDDETGVGLAADDDPPAIMSYGLNLVATSQCGALSEVVPHPPGGEIFRRVFDVAFALVLLVLLLPLLATIAMLIWVTSPGPVIYRQIRAGRHGQFFVLRKFRTMRVDADLMLEQDPQLKAQFASRWKLEQDPRVTPIGRWLRKASLDELPQLINVLRGDMSFVGPRPVQPVELEDVYADCASIVFSVKPGLTGLWQVAGRSSVSYEERIALDLEYLRRRSGWFDLLLIARTIPAVVLMRGAS